MDNKAGCQDGSRCQGLGGEQVHWRRERSKSWEARAPHGSCTWVWKSRNHVGHSGQEQKSSWTSSPCGPADSHRRVVGSFIWWVKTVSRFLFPIIWLYWSSIPSYDSWPFIFLLQTVFLVPLLVILLGPSSKSSLQSTLPLCLWQTFPCFQPLAFHMFPDFIPIQIYKVWKLYIYIYVYVYTYNMYICIPICVCVCIYTYTHTHSHFFPSSGLAIFYFINSASRAIHINLFLNLRSDRTIHQYFLQFYGFIIYVMFKSTQLYL